MVETAKDCIALADKRGGILTVVLVDQTFRMYGVDFVIDYNPQAGLPGERGLYNASERTTGCSVAHGVTANDAEKQARKVLRKHGKDATLAAIEHCRVSHPLNVAN